MFKDKDEKLRDPIANREYIEQKLKFPISIHTSTENSDYLDMNLSYHLLSGFYGKKIEHYNYVVDYIVLIIIYVIQLLDQVKKIFKKHKL